MQNIPFLLLFVLASGFNFLLQEGLEFIDFRARKKDGGRVPKELFGYADSKLLKKTAAYENEKYFLFIPEHVLGFILSLVLVFAGYYVFLYNRLFRLTGSVYLTALFFSLLVYFIFLTLFFFCLSIGYPFCNNIRQQLILNIFNYFNVSWIIRLVSLSIT